MMNKTLWTFIGFLLFSIGIMALVLSLVGIELAFLNFTGKLGGMTAFLFKIALTVGGLILVALARTDWEQQEDDFVEE